MIYFIGDTHFFHHNILRFPENARPFESVEHMNEHIISKWNSVVTPDDTVYHLGDVCFAGAHNLKIMDRLNGRKHLVLGNHDHHPKEEYLKYFHKINGVMVVRDAVLTHIPVHPNQLARRWKYNIHGHMHSHKVLDGQMPDKRYINVSCEQVDYTPITFDEVLKRAR